MKQLISIKSLALLSAVLLLGGCASTPKPGFDYSAFRQDRPGSILVLPPLNDSPDIKATYSLLSLATAPLAESGYYVFPVALVDETLKQNGMTTPADIHEVPVNKFREIFGADAALYIKITRYGSTYTVLVSESRATAEGRLVDLRSGKTLWVGSATASSSEQDNNSGGLAVMLIKAVVNQIASNLSDRDHQIAGITSQRLLAAGSRNGILYGPRSPLYLKDGAPAP